MGQCPILCDKKWCSVISLEIGIRSVSLTHVHSVGVVWYAWK